MQDPPSSNSRTEAVSPLYQICQCSNSPYQSPDCKKSWSVWESVREGCVHVHGGAQPDGHPNLVSLAHQHSSSSSLSPNRSLLTSAPPLNLKAASQGKVWKSEAALRHWPSPVNIHSKWEPLVELQLIYWSNYQTPYSTFFWLAISVFKFLSTVLNFKPSFYCICTAVPDIVAGLLHY